LSWKEEALTRVLAVIGPDIETLAGAERAIAFAREHGAELDLLAVAERPARLMPGRTVAERREAAAGAHLREATASARAAGVPPRLAALRRGRMVPVLTRFAVAADADVVFLTRVRPRWWARILGRPRAELQEITISRRARIAVDDGTMSIPAKNGRPTTPGPTRAHTPAAPASR
jgi:hypothetical protein